LLKRVKLPPDQYPSFYPKSSYNYWPSATFLTHRTFSWRGTHNYWFGAPALYSTLTMAEGDGNIKVVVRCRPLNSRGAFVRDTHVSSILIPTFVNSRLQNLHEVPNHLSGCRAIRLSSTHRNKVLSKTPNALRNARRWPSVSIGVIGLRDHEMNQGTARSRLCMTTWERSCWTMGLRDLMLVFWLVSGFLLDCFCVRRCADTMVWQMGKLVCLHFILLLSMTHVH
jgi:hypothetical protein